ncbi:Fibronectin type III domain-containing protein [Perilla frutescens var. hirtella]|nr:Fibronectin type III domain-containing protein [Perilla frutescens var. hirtella]
MAEEVHRTLKNQALKRLSSDLENQDSVEQNKRGKCSFLKPLDSSLWICENPACGTTQSTGPRFCKGCSCCICHQFDKNKDPSLWFKCTPDSGSEGSCGFSCHVECALRHGKVGVRALQVQLDGCFSCASCGKVSSIIGCWKKQLKMAMDTNCVDVLCYRIFLSYRLLNGTSKFSEVRGGVGFNKRSSGKDFTQLVTCKLAIEKAEQLLTLNPSSVLNLNGTYNILHLLGLSSSTNVFEDYDRRA